MIISLLVLVIVCALALYVIENLITDETLRKVFRVVVVVLAVLALLHLLTGLYPGSLGRWGL